MAWEPYRLSHDTQTPSGKEAFLVWLLSGMHVADDFIYQGMFLRESGIWSLGNCRAI